MSEVPEGITITEGTHLVQAQHESTGATALGATREEAVQHLQQYLEGCQ